LTLYFPAPILALVIHEKTNSKPKNQFSMRAQTSTPPQAIGTVVMRLAILGGIVLGFVFAFMSVVAAAARILQ
jgi:hypothetical protein